jgi:DNA-directed RNA polymerase subunit RPC12/RpoP
LGQLVEKERGHYIEQIELLHEKVGRLQHQINGDLVEPEYLAVAYSVEGRISNDIAREVFIALHIPLAVKGYHVKPDGSTSVSTDLKMTVPSNPTIGGESQSSQKPHCPHCGSDFLNLLNDGRYRCLDCKKRFVTSKIVWK